MVRLEMAARFANGVGRAFEPRRAFRRLLRGEDLDEAAGKLIHAGR